MKYPVIGGSIVIGVAALVVFSPRAALAQQVELSFEAGRVTLAARDATIREVLDLWARRGHVTVVNAELAGEARVSLQLDEVLERQALEAVLGGVAGYVIVERGPDSTGPAVFDRVFVVAQGGSKAVLRSGTGIEAAAVTPPDDRLAARLPVDAITVHLTSDSAVDEAPGSPVAIADAEPPDGRPDAAHPAPAVVTGWRDAAVDRRRGQATNLEPPDGRDFKARPIPPHPIGPRSAPMPAVVSAKSTTGALKGPAGDVKTVKDTNGREPAK